MKRRFYIYLFVSFFLITAVTLVVIYQYHRKSLEQILHFSKESVVNLVRTKIIEHFRILKPIDREMRQIGSRALKRLSEAFEKIDVAALSPEQMRQMAIEQGVDEIYLINRNGIVFKTSFKPDQDFNLFEIGKDFKNYLISIFDKDQIKYQSMDASHQTGIRNMYLYYGPKARDYLIEVSIEYNKFIESRYGTAYKSFLFEEYYAIQRDNFEYLSAFDIFHRSKHKTYSLIHKNKVFEADHIFDQLDHRNEAIVERGDQVIVYKKVRFRITESKWSAANFLVMEFDFSEHNRMKRSIIRNYLLFGALVLLIVFFIFSKIFNHQFIDRIERINTGIKKLEQGDYDTVIPVERNDEIGNIGQNINYLASIVKERVDLLENLLPICSHCKKIRNDRGYWQDVDEYMNKHFKAKLTHSLCPPCVDELYPDLHGSKKNETPDQ